MTETDPTAALRRRLAARGRCPVRVRLASGPCWVMAVGVSGRHLEVTLAGARIRLGVDALLEVSP